MWMIDSTYRIFVQDLGENASQIIPRLQPVGGKTVMQVFGFENDIYKIKGKVVGYLDHDAIKAMVQDGVTHNLSDGITASGLGYDKDFYINSFSSSRNKSVYQTLRTDLDCAAPVFDIELEVYYDG